MHKWTYDEDKLAYCCAKFNISKENCTKIAKAIGIDLIRQLQPRITDYKSHLT